MTYTVFASIGTINSIFFDGDDMRDNAARCRKEGRVRVAKRYDERAEQLYQLARLLTPSKLDDGVATYDEIASAFAHEMDMSRIVHNPEAFGYYQAAYELAQTVSKFMRH